VRSGRLVLIETVISAEPVHPLLVGRGVESDLQAFRFWWIGSKNIVASRACIAHGLEWVPVHGPWQGLPMLNYTEACIVIL
jgi:hypothetical protein